MTPVSISSGSLPVTVIVCTRARGVKPRARARSALMMSAAEAPSVSGEELPGVMSHPMSGNRRARSSVRKAEGRAASRSAEVPARTVSSTRWMSSTRPRQ